MVYNYPMTSQDILKFAKIIGKSKKIKRSGWVREKINNPESVAEHSFRLIALSMVLAPLLDVDQDKLIKMAILHDLGETETGDLVVERGKQINPKLRTAKEIKEENIVRRLLGVFGKEYYEIFHEMIQRKSRESKIFWQLDKLEMAIQAHEYQEEQNKDLSEFFQNAKIHISDSTLKSVLDLLNE